MSNKYEQIPDHIIDLHGYTTAEAERELNLLFKSGKYKHIRIITGKGADRSGPILREFVKNHLNAYYIRFNIAKREHGGDGALEVLLS